MSTLQMVVDLIGGEGFIARRLSVQVMQDITGGLHRAAATYHFKQVTAIRDLHSKAVLHLT